MPVATKKLRSNRAWIERHINDPFVKRSKAEGYRARSVYKLTELDDREHLLRRGMTVVDLGAAPGSWTQIVRERLVGRDGKVDDFGTLTDVKASITTKAYDPIDGDSNIGMGNFLTIEDKVAYANLFPGRNYKLVAELHDAKTGEVLYDGKTVEHTFTAQEPSGFEVIRIDGIDTFGFAGKTITVYEKLYDEGGSLIAKHTDKDLSLIHI